MRRHRLHLTVRPAALALAGALFLAPLALRALPAPPLLLNLSGSAPVGIYVKTGRELAVGEWVAACLPEALGQFARARGYVGEGTCPGGAAPVIKRIAARAGQRVLLEPEGLRIDGKLLPASSIPDRDSRGQPVEASVAYPYTVPEGYVLLLNPHPLSFDGRLFGPLPEASLLGTYRLLWRFPR